jgi:hypothetical protein
MTFFLHEIISDSEETLKLSLKARLTHIFVAINHLVQVNKFLGLEVEAHTYLWREFPALAPVGLRSSSKLHFCELSNCVRDMRLHMRLNLRNGAVIQGYSLHN